MTGLHALSRVERETKEFLVAAHTQNADGMNARMTEHVDAAARIEELCGLFSMTVSSLASDVAALHEIKSLAVCINGENDNPNEIKDGLQEVESAVTELEGKVSMLQEIVAEEKRSLKDMEKIKVAAEAQLELLKDMLRATDSVIRQAAEEKIASSQAVVATSTPRRDRAPVPASAHGGILRSGAKRVIHRRDSIDPREKHDSSMPSIHLARVTEAEWNNVSRNVRGRITLAVVNDALRDIERVFQQKYAALSHTSSYRKGPPAHVELQQKLLNSHREFQVEEHGDSPWVSEQDLRQCCAFFRNGESTARAILLIVRAVRRLKQVPAKHSQVTYICLSSED